MLLFYLYFYFYLIWTSHTEITNDNKGSGIISIKTLHKVIFVKKPLAEELDTSVTRKAVCYDPRFEFKPI